MTNQSPEPAKLSHKAGKLIVQGAIGAVSLTATAAIPLAVQRMMAPPAAQPSATPAATQMQMLSPSSSTAPAIASPSPTVQPVSTASEDEAPEKRKGKDKHHKPQ